MRPQWDYFLLFPALIKCAGVPETQPPYRSRASLPVSLISWPPLEVGVVASAFPRNGDQARSSCLPGCGRGRGDSLEKWDQNPGLPIPTKAHILSAGPAPSRSPGASPAPTPHPSPACELDSRQLGKRQQTQGRAGWK